MNNALIHPQDEMVAQVKVIYKENRPLLNYSLFSYNFKDEDMHINKNYLDSIHDLNYAEVYYASHSSQLEEKVKAAIKGQIAGSKRNVRKAGLESV